MLNNVVEYYKIAFVFSYSSWQFFFFFSFPSSLSLSRASFFLLAWSFYFNSLLVSLLHTSCVFIDIQLLIQHKW